MEHIVLLKLEQALMHRLVPLASKASVSSLQRWISAMYQFPPVCALCPSQTTAAPPSCRPCISCRCSRIVGSYISGCFEAKLKVIRAEHAAASQWCGIPTMSASAKMATCFYFYDMWHICYIMLEKPSFLFMTYMLHSLEQLSFFICDKYVTLFWKSFHSRKQIII